MDDEYIKNMSISVDSAQRLQTLTGHTSDVTSCDFAPNFTLVTGSSDKTVRIWEWIPGRGYVERANSPLKGHKYGVTCVRVSPQGSMIASASIDGTAVLWSLHSLQKIYTMVQVNGDAIRVCRFAPDSSILVTAGDNGAICVWDLIHRHLVRTIFEHEATTQCLAFTPDSQYLVSACSAEVINIWHVESLLDTANDGNVIPLCTADNAHDLGLLYLDISNNIRVDDDDPFTKYYSMVASGNSDQIKIWTIRATTVPKHRNSKNFVALEEYGCFHGHNSAVTCVEFSSSGSNFISSSMDKQIKIWDMSGTCLFSLRGHSRYVNCVKFSRDMTLIASGSNDRSVIIWDLTNNLTLDSELRKVTLANSVEGIQEENVVTNAETSDNNIELVEKIEDLFEGSVNSCSIHDSYLVATGSSDKLVRLFTISEDHTLEEANVSPLEGHSYAVNHVEFSKDGSMLATCSLDGCTTIWSSRGECLSSLPENKLSIKVCCFSPDGKCLLTAGDDEIACVWDVGSLSLICNLEGHSDAIASANFSPDGNVIVTTCSNSDFRIWVLDRNIFIRDDAHDLGILSSDFSPNLEPVPNFYLLDVQNYLLVTSGNDGMVKLWTISIPKGENEALMYDSVDVKLWRKMQGHGGNVYCVRFSPGAGELVCSTSTDRQARIWSVFSGICLHVLDHDGVVTSCAFSQDCQILITGCLNKTLWVWKLPQQLVFQNVVSTKLKCRTKVLADWNVQDVLKWFSEIGAESLHENVTNSKLNGAKIIQYTEMQLVSGLDIADETLAEKLTDELRWLKQDDQYFNSTYWNKINNIPEEYICPITQEIMREPVTISDGFTYEKRAITEWFMSGKYTSPMTNLTLENTEYNLNQELRNQIHQFLYSDIE